MTWWSKQYNRPLKDPILQTYSLEELAYEYYSHIEQYQVQQERIQEESDKIEEAKEQEAEDWANEMEAEEAAVAKAVSEQKPDPTKDPANIAWMEEEIRKSKELLGEDFGEDLNLEFEGKDG